MEEKELFEDFTVNTIIGKNRQGAIVTMNDRASGILRMKKVETRHAELMYKLTIELLLFLNPLFFKTLKVS